jgi:hypothetical protein
LPDDDEEAIRRNYQFIIDLELDASYCQMLSPFPKTKLREHLISEGLLVNADHYERYNGLWANVKTRHLEADQLQYAFWQARQTVLGWWKPSTAATWQGRLWTSLWTYLVKPVMKFFVDRQIRKIGWEGRYQKNIRHLEMMNHFEDLQPFRVKDHEHRAGRGAGGGLP